MRRVRLGAVGYLNARPLVYGLERSPRVAVRFDVPSRCATLLHEGAIDVGLIPSIEYLRRPGYRIVPDLAIASRGRVASVVLVTRQPLVAIRSVATDSASRTSVALLAVLCERAFGIHPRAEAMDADVAAMLERCDAALLIGDHALLIGAEWSHLERIDLGEAWQALTGLPFVYAFWAGPEQGVSSAEVTLLQEARDAGVGRLPEIARDYFPGAPERQAIGRVYLRDNIHYHLGEEERAGLALFYRYAAELGLVSGDHALRFY